MQETHTPQEPQTQSQVEGSERAYELDSDIIDLILAAANAGDREGMIALLEPLHAADIADMLEQLPRAKAAEILSLWGSEIDGDVLSELDEGLRADFIDQLTPEAMVEALKDLESDDVVDLVEYLEVPQQTRVLDALEGAERVAVEQALQYPEESAGRLMQRELVMAPSHWTVGDAIDHLRKESDLPYRFYAVMIVDPTLQPIGKVVLSDLLSSPRDTVLSTIMDENFHIISVLQSQEDVGYAFNQYHMVSAPVVDEDGRLVGVITIDDAMDVLDEATDEDLKLLAGVGDESLFDSFFDTARQRFPWLAVNLATAIMASLVISVFSSTIEAIVALAILMPIVASMGGNAGTQTLTVTVRALATKDLTSSNALRIIGREVMVGLLNGLAFAVIIGIIGVLWFGTPMLGVVLALAMVVNMVVAGLAGILVPISLTKLNIDPALASGAFVTTVTDVVGFFAFLGLAALLLL